MQHDEGDRLWAAVDALPERCRRLLRIVAFENRPDYRELATDLGHAGRQHRTHPGPVPGQAARGPDAGRRSG